MFTALMMVAFVLGADEKDAFEVRKLDQKVFEKAKPAEQHKPGVKALTSKDAVAKEFNKDVAEAVAKVVDFTKEEVVYFTYHTGGPPFGQPKFTANAKDKKVEFYVLEPKTGARGEALKLGQELYAIPKGAKVSYGGLK